MLVLRCTRKLLTRLKADPVAEPQPSTTVLGDWYADILVSGRRKILLCTSEHARFPVVLATNDVRSVVSQLPEALAVLLWDLSVPPRSIEREIHEMATGQFAKTASRSVLGTMNDYAIAITWALAEEPGLSLHHLSLRLTDTPVRPMKGQCPADVARRLLAEL
jgi:hypothetical protein